MGQKYSRRIEMVWAGAWRLFSGGRAGNRNFNDVEVNDEYAMNMESMSVR